MEIFTDGSCLGKLRSRRLWYCAAYIKTEKTLSQGFQLTTNNRMEMMAAVVALKTLKEPCHVILTD
ncbi:hypothetical protein P4S72_01645 [Vibrio sp. PP-XX7]